MVHPLIPQAAALPNDNRNLRGKRPLCQSVKRETDGALPVSATRASYSLSTRCIRSWSIRMGVSENAMIQR